MMEIKDFAAVKRRLEYELRDLIGTKLSKFEKDTGISPSGVNVQTKSIERIGRPVTYLVTQVTVDAAP